MEADQDLHIAKHVEPENLPTMIQPIMALAQSDAERDMLLLSLITAADSCMPNLYFRYGLTGKKYYPNLQCFIVGSAACGKGIANLALELVSKVHEALPRGGCNYSRQEPSPFHGDVSSLARTTHERCSLQAVSELREGGVSKRKAEHTLSVLRLLRYAVNGRKTAPLLFRYCPFRGVGSGG